MQNIEVKRNQIWKHFKGTTYCIYGVATTKKLNLKYVLYYKCEDNTEKVDIPPFVISEKTLARWKLQCGNINDPISNLIIVTYDPNYNPRSTEQMLRNNKECYKDPFIWARKINNFLEKEEETGLNRFQLVGNI